MAQFTGFYSGVKEGKEFQREQLAAEDIHKGRLQEMAIKDQEYTQKLKSQKLMSQYFNAKSVDKNGKEDYNTSQGLSSKLYQAGRAMMGVDPKLGIDLMKEGTDMEHKGQEDLLRGLQINSAKHEAVAEAALRTNDQASLNETVSEFAKAGKVVPPEFRVWNDQTKNWLQQQAKGTKAEKTLTELEIKTKASELAYAKEKRQADESKAKLDLQERKFANLRNNTGKDYKAPKVDELYSSAKDLADRYPDVGDLRPAERRTVAGDIDRRAYFHLKEGTTTDPATALSMAEEEVVSRIKDGKYEGFKPEDVQSEKDMKQQYPNAPAVGTVKAGYKFKGGNPADKSNWEKT